MEFGEIQEQLYFPVLWRIFYQISCMRCIRDRWSQILTKPIAIKGHSYLFSPASLGTNVILSSICCILSVNVALNIATIVLYYCLSTRYISCYQSWNELVKCQVEFDEEGKFCGVTSEGETAKGKKVVCDPSYLTSKVILCPDLDLDFIPYSYL